MSRRKNKHPKRAVNVETVVVASAAEEREEREREERVLCLRIPDEDDDFEANHQIQKEETTFKKRGAKRKRTQQHECDVCEMTCRDSYALKVHMRIHTNERPYECDVCEKRFRESGTFKRHMCTHTNEKAYECEVCEKRYRSASGLWYHMRTQH